MIKLSSLDIKEAQGSGEKEGDRFAPLKVHKKSVPKSSIKSVLKS